MLLRYFRIPDTEYALLGGSNGFTMHIDLVDGRTGNFGFHNFGYLHPNQTLESTADAMRYYLNHLSTDSRTSQIRMRKAIQNNYFLNEGTETGLKNVFYSTVSNIDDCFSNNTDFTNHWYFDHNYFNNRYDATRYFDSAISTGTYRPEDATNLPFNNDGGFFRGWHENDEVGGFVAADFLRYRFISRPFVLSGSGIISIKMAGKASLHVIDATVQNTDSQPADLAWIDNNVMNMSGDAANIASSGFNVCTMVNHVINLEAYLGKTIQLAICDYDESGWSACYFDELVSYYESAPAFHVDSTTQTNTSGTFYPSYPDVYVNSACKSGENASGVIYNGGNSVNTADDNAILNHTDSSSSYAAYNVWKIYLNTVRGGNQGTNYCSMLTDDGVKEVINTYASLSNAAKQIVCASDDFERVGSGDWYTINPTIYTSSDSYNLSRTIQYLADVNNISVTVYNSGALSLIKFMQLDNPTSISVISFLLLGAVALLATLTILKKKKKFNK